MKIFISSILFCLLLSSLVTSSPTNLQLDSTVECTNTTDLLKFHPQELFLCAKQQLYRQPNLRRDSDSIVYSTQDVNIIEFTKVEGVQWPYYPNGKDQDDIDPFRVFHRVKLFIPQNVDIVQTGFFYIEGGSNNAQYDQNPTQDGELKQGNLNDLTYKDQILIETAKDLKTVVIVMYDAPNQPITFSGGDPLYEDAIISYTWRKFIENPEKYAYYPLHLPMTISAITIMDGAQSILKQYYNIDIHDFIVAGYSKRGWTAWMTSLIDTRVRAVVPIVIDILKTRDQLREILNTYGFRYPIGLEDYNQNGVLNQNNFSPDHFRNFDLLMKIMDPVDYRFNPKYESRLSIPKYLINSSGDEIFIPQGSQIFFKYLLNQDQSFQLIVANQPHYILEYKFWLPLKSFFFKTIQQQPLHYPKFEYQTYYYPNQFQIQAQFTCLDGISCEESDLQAKLWVAENKIARDFRYYCMGQYQQFYPKATNNTGIYISQDVNPTKIDARNLKIIAQIDIPENGWKSVYLEVKDQTHFTISTSAYVIQGKNITPYSSMPQNHNTSSCYLQQTNTDFF